MYCKVEKSPIQSKCCKANTLFLSAVYIGCYTGRSSEDVLQDSYFLDDGSVTALQCHASCAER